MGCSWEERTYTMASSGPTRKKTVVEGAEHDGALGQNEEETIGAGPAETDDEALARALQVRWLAAAHVSWGVRWSRLLLLLTCIGRFQSSPSHAFLLVERVHNYIVSLLAQWRPRDMRMCPPIAEADLADRSRCCVCSPRLLSSACMYVCVCVCASHLTSEK